MLLARLRSAFRIHKYRFTRPTPAKNKKQKAAVNSIGNKVGRGTVSTQRQADSRLELTYSHTISKSRNGPQIH